MKSRTSDKFYSRLYGLAGKREFPLKVLFELTYACNFQCVHCYNVKEAKNELGTSQVKGILKELARSGCFHVGFTGGEPFTRKDIFEILDFAKRSGFRITILTNGYLIDRKAADKIAALGTSLNKVDISVLGGDKKTFESVTRKKGSFANAEKTIKLLKQRGVCVMIKSGFMRQNKGGFGKIREMAASSGCMFRYSPILNAKTDGSKGPLKHRLSPEEVIELSNEFRGVKKKPGAKTPARISPGKNRFLRCGSGRTEASINPYGELKLCPDINQTVYDIRQLGLDRAWKKLKEYVKSLEGGDYACKSCYLAGFCNSCPARMVVEEGDLNKCNMYDRDLAILYAKENGSWDKIKDKLRSEDIRV